MFNRKTKWAACLTVSALASLSTATSFAQLVYENGFEGYSGQRTSAANGVVGDVVGLTQQGVLSSASFGYFLNPTLRSGNETASLSIYSLDAGGLPGTLLFSSSAFDITGTTAEGFGTLNVNDILTFVPNSIGYTITFGGLTAGEEAGLLFSNDPTLVGTNPTFFDDVTSAQEHFTIRNNGGTFERLNFPGVIDNLNASFTVVPEPSTFALLIGGLAAMGLIRRRK
jgi:hypothetical protein